MISWTAHCMTLDRMGGLSCWCQTAGSAAALVSAPSQGLQVRLQEQAEHHTYREGPVC